MRSNRGIFWYSLGLTLLLLLPPWCRKLPPSNRAWACAGYAQYGWPAG